jgi:hypothetical protein
MVNELIEAKNNNELNRVTQRWTRYELIVIDELAYVAMLTSDTSLTSNVGGPYRDFDTLIEKGRFVVTITAALSALPAMIWNNNSARQGRKNDFVDAERLVKRLVANELTLSFRQNPLGDGTGGGRLPSEEAVQATNFLPRPVPVQPRRAANIEPSIPSLLLRPVVRAANRPVIAIERDCSQTGAVQMRTRRRLRRDCP